MITHDRRIAENTASDRQRVYMETLFSDRAIVGDRERSKASVIPAIRRSRSDHMETRLKLLMLEPKFVFIS